MYHALLAGGPERLTTAGKLGLPQVLCPGAIEVLVFNEPETVPLPYRNRTLIRHSPQITDVRLDKAEMAAVGREVARRLQHTTEPAVLSGSDGRIRQLFGERPRLPRSRRRMMPSCRS